MSAEPRVISDDSDRPELIAVCSRAFWHDPLFDFLASASLLAEYELLPHVFRAAFRDFDTPTAMRYAVKVDGRPRCFAAWLPPGSFPRSTPEQWRRAVRSVGVLLRVGNRRRAARLLRESTADIRISPTGISVCSPPTPVPRVAVLARSCCSPYSTGATTTAYRHTPRPRRTRTSHGTHGPDSKRSTKSDSPTRLRSGACGATRTSV